MSSIPVRSQLYRLVPAGAGTLLVESLTSFLMRLAAAHQLTPGKLIRIALPGLWRGARSGNLLPQGEVYRGGQFANGLGPEAGAWVREIGRATRRDDLDRLTLLPWQAVLPPTHLLRPNLGHCPQCLEDMVGQGVVHEPLAWALRMVTACPTHGIDLAFHCPNCRAKQRSFRWNGRPGLCGKCNSWLGATGVGAAASSEAQRISRSVAGLLLPRLPIAAALSIAETIALAQAELGSTQKALALAAGVSPGSMSEWLRGHVRPSIEGVLAICSLGGWDPRSFLGGSLVPAAASASAPQSPWMGRKPIDWDQARREAEAHLTDDPPITLAELAQVLGVDLSWMRSQLPEVTRALVERHRGWRRERTRQRGDGHVDRVVRTTRILLDAGHSASRREVERHLPPGMQLRESALGAAWRATRRDFELEVIADSAIPA